MSVREFISLVISIRWMEDGLPIGLVGGLTSRERRIVQGRCKALLSMDLLDLV